MNSFVYSIFLSVITLLVGIYVRYSVKKINGALKRIEANNKGTMTVLLTLLTEYYEFAKEKGYTSMEYKQKAQSVYDAYHEMGGNGLGTQMYEFIIKSPLKKEEKEDE